MRRRTTWLILGCLIMASLVLASCSSDTDTDTPTDTPTDTSDATVEDTGPEMVTDSLGRLVQAPQYGGTITFQAATPDWDPLIQPSVGHADLTFQGMTFFDWLRGPSGTGEFRYDGWYAPDESKVGALAESWEIVDLTTAIYHIRPGVRWQDSSLLNGRELVADDVVYSLEEMQDHPRSMLFRAPDGPTRITSTALDEYTVEIKFPKPELLAWTIINNQLVIIPPEVEAAGLNWDDWNTSVGTGTGPYYLEEVVEGTSFTLRRNPDYWQYDPLHPENRLPYPDLLRGLLIDDPSTQLAALRSGAIDMLGYPTITLTEKKDLTQTNPELQYYERLPTDAHLWFRLDEGMFVDKRLRQALNMAVDNEAITRELYDGDAEYWAFPFLPDFGSEVYVAREDLPPEIKEIYTYNPEKAKQLLEDAGYPDGFDFEVTANNTRYGQTVDILSIYKEYFADIGVEMTINLVEYGTFWDILGGGEFEDAGASPHGVPGPYYVWGVQADADHYWNMSKIGDPFIAEKMEEMALTVDTGERNNIQRELILYWFDRASLITMPRPLAYTFWQPWLKGYSGEFIIGTENGYRGSLIFAWVDQELKTEMGQ